MIEKFDENSDGLISFRELQADQPPVCSEKFLNILIKTMIG